MAALFAAQDIFKAAALRGAPRYKFRALWREGRREFIGPPQKRRSCHQVRLRRCDGRGIAEKSIHRYVIPGQDFQGIQVIDNGQSIELVKAGYHTSVLDISRAADVHRELRAGVCPGEPKARALAVPVCQPETFAPLPKPPSLLPAFSPA